MYEHQIAILKEQIEEGVEFLNKKFPDWVNWIDLDRLNMRLGCDCICGQLRFEESFHSEYGFYLRESLFPGVDNCSYREKGWELLNDLWKAKILELRKCQLAS